jgi:guanylate kinase
LRATKAFPIVISGPSGVGKTTLVNGLLESVSMLKRSVSMTTRRPRNGEVEGDHYFFVSAEDFESAKDTELIEWAEVHTACYGTPRGFVEKNLEKGLDVVLNIDVQGGRDVKKCFPEALTIFILPPSFKVLEQRIRERATDPAEDIETRLENAREETRAMPDYEFVVVNDSLDHAIATLRAIILSERCRRTRYPDDLVEKFCGGASL